MVENVIIMAGGAGKRLWPASMGKRPKQFLRVDGDVTLFRGTLERAFDLGISGNIYVVTHEDHVDAAVEECRLLDDERKSRVMILAEPVARNTAPALALAAARMTLDGRDTQSCLVMPADHLITPPEAFIRSVKKAAGEASDGFIVPFGIVPDSPATGYGYIETGERAGSGFEVLSFREKPDEKTAEEYLSSGRHYWNSGLFTYRNDVFLSELEVCTPDVSKVFANPDEKWFVSRLVEKIQIFEPSETLRALYNRCPGISMDYAVMEKTNKIRMVKADFNWNDVGSWDVIAELGKTAVEPVYSYQAERNYVYSDRPVALCGVDDLIVVVANNRVMICKKGMSQLVKEVAERDLSEK